MLKNNLAGMAVPGFGQSFRSTHICSEKKKAFFNVYFISVMIIGTEKFRKQ